MAQPASFPPLIPMFRELQRAMPMTIPEQRRKKQARLIHVLPLWPDMAETATARKTRKTTAAPRDKVPLW